MKELAIVVKADVQGSAEAVKQSLEKISNDEDVYKRQVMIGAEDSHITGKCRDGRVVELFRNGVWVL